jgi:hypothetical protein
MPRPDWTMILLLVLPCVTGMADRTGTHLYTQPVTEMGFHELFAWAGLKTLVLPISASQVARITDLSHWPWPSNVFKNRKVALVGS